MTSKFVGEKNLVELESKKKLVGQGNSLKVVKEVAHIPALLLLVLLLNKFQNEVARDRWKVLKQEMMILQYSSVRKSLQ